MDLSHKTNENLQFMIEQIKTKLNMAAGAAISPNHFTMDHYEDILDIYEMVMNKPRFSISEMEAIARELGQLRNK